MSTEQLTCETTILGGLPVIATATLNKAEPDVGYMTPWIDEVHLTWLSGHGLPDKMIARISYPQWEGLREALMESRDG